MTNILKYNGLNEKWIWKKRYSNRDG